MAIAKLNYLLIMLFTIIHMSTQDEEGEPTEWRVHEHLNDG